MISELEDFITWLLELAKEESRFRLIRAAGRSIEEIHAEMAEIVMSKLRGE
jgi:hypothetical protein